MLKRGNVRIFNSQLVEAADQILPLFMMDSLGNVKGMPGIFVAGLTCASLRYDLKNEFTRSKQPHK